MLDAILGFVCRLICTISDRDCQHRDYDVIIRSARNVVIFGQLGSGLARALFGVRAASAAKRSVDSGLCRIRLKDEHSTAFTNGPTNGKCYNPNHT